MSVLARGSGFGHVLDQPGDVELVADDAGGADQAALAVGQFSDLAGRCFTKNDLERDVL